MKKKFAIIKCTIDGSEMFFVAGLVDKINERRQDISFQKVIESSYPDWRKFYPNQIPFNMDYGYYYQELVGKYDSEEKCLEKVMLLKIGGG